jgi:acetylornithine deacetylase/succinyl-diaminopimelate desuccinylase-like protein
MNGSVRVAGKAHLLKRIVVGMATVVLHASALYSLNAGTMEEPAPVMASSHISVDHLQKYSDLALDWMREYLRIDTTNPPGHEMRAVTFYKRILDQENIESRAFEYAAGRGDLWARLPHTTAEAKRPLILLNHMDVVTSDPAHWRFPPFSGEIKDGSLWGRGAQDMKDEGLAQLVVMVMLKREKVELDRDVIFLAVADEEADGTGTDWFIAHQRNLLGDAEFFNQ